jgi:hypothetical protein
MAFFLVIGRNISKLMFEKPNKQKEPSESPPNSDA